MDNCIQDKSALVSRAVKKYSDTVRRVCFIYLKSPHDVEDIFQEVFLQLLRREDEFESDAHEKAWLIKVAVNKCKDFHKSFYRSKVCSLNDMEISFEDDVTTDLVREVLALPQRYRDVLYLFYYEGYTVPEISEIIAVRVNTLYSRLHRAKRILKERLDI